VLDAARNDAERAEASIGLSHQVPARNLPTDARLPAERIAALTAGGDPVTGERLFFHPQIASCYRCHEHNGRGAAIGPDLTTFGRGASRERILQSMLEPSREVAPHYVPWIIETTDGRTLTGLYVGEEVKGEHRYADAQGKIFLVHPNDIERRDASKQSIMPADFGKSLTDDELRDLASFLQQR
jgi:putative heme-binding domain-containing protein